MKKTLPLVSIITVNYNGKAFLKDCLKSLLNLNYPKKKIEIFMIDNGSVDGSLDYVRKQFPAVKILINDENSYAKANNLGIKAAKGEYIALINNDVKVDKDWLIRLIKTAQEDISIGAVGSKILFMDGSIQSIGHQEYPNFYWGDIGFKDKDSVQYSIIKEVTSICGCSVLYSRKCLKDVGLLDEDFNMFLEDVDMSIRCRKKGWKLVTCPQSIIYHKFHSTIGSEDRAKYWQEMNRLLLIAKHWPDKLVDAFAGKLYFTAKDNHSYADVKDISDILGNVFVKLIKEHGLEVTNKLSGGLFEAIRKIYNFEKDYLIQIAKGQNLTISIRDQQVISLRQSKDQEIAAKNQELTLLRQQIQQVRKELNDIYTSTGYKYLLKPLWDFLWSLKRFPQKSVGFIRKIIRFFMQIPKLKGKLKNNSRFMRFYHLDNLFSIMLHAIYRLGNPWLDAYWNHLNNGTLPPKPDTVILMLTKRCNLSCDFCDVRNSNEDISFQDTIRIIDNISQLGITWLIITGGEPFLHSRLFDIIKYAKNINLKTSINTNGSLICENIDKIRDSQVDMISISLDGIGPTHDELRRSRGLYEKVKNGILELNKIGQNISINFVITNQNVHELEGLYNWAKNQKILVDFWPVNYHKELYIDRNKDYKPFIKFIRKLKNKGDISRYKYRYYIKSILYLGNNYNLKVRCLGLTKHLGIYVTGDILPCCVWGKGRINLGNAIRDDIKTLWYSRDYWEFRNSIYKKGCSAGCYNSSLYEFTAITGKDFIISDKSSLKGDNNG